MIREANLPVSILAGNAAVATLAAVGALFLLPIPVTREASIVAMPILALAIGASLLFAGRGVADRARKDALDQDATDPGTGLATAEHAERVLVQEFAAAQRGRPLTIVLFRVTGLTGYASRHGRAVAEQFLRTAGRTLARHRRKMHLVAVQGAPGVFLAVLSGMDRKGASIYAARMRRVMMTPTGVPKPQGISAGIASYDVSMSSTRDLLDQAKRAADKGYAAGGKIVVVGQLPGAPIGAQSRGQHF